MVNVSSSSSTTATEPDAERGKREVLALSDRVLSMGIHSIPTLIVDGTLLISGAQTSDVVLAALERVAAKGATITFDWMPSVQRPISMTHWGSEH